MRDPSMLASDPEISAWVAANAGAGKTYTLANRVARLLLEDSSCGVARSRGAPSRKGRREGGPEHASRPTIDAGRRGDGGRAEYGV